MADLRVMALGSAEMRDIELVKPLVRRREGSARESRSDDVGRDFGPR